MKKSNQVQITPIMTCFDAYHDISNFKRIHAVFQWGTDGSLPALSTYVQSTKLLTLLGHQVP